MAWNEVAGVSYTCEMLLEDGDNLLWDDTTEALVSDQTPVAVSKPTTSFNSIPKPTTNYNSIPKP